MLPKHPLNVQQTSTWLVQQLAQLHEQVQADCSPGSQPQQQVQYVICTDQGYLHQLPELQQAVQQSYSGPMQLVFAQSAPTELWPQQDPAAAAAAACAAGSSCCNGSAAEAASAGNSQPSQAAATARVPTGGLLWQQPSSSSSSLPQMVWLGPLSSPALTHLQLSHASCTWLLLDLDSQGVSQGLSPGLDRLLKRRYYLVERARGSSMVGLLVGTLGAAGYKTALEQLRRLAAEVGCPSQRWLGYHIGTEVAVRSVVCLGIQPLHFVSLSAGLRNVDQHRVHPRCPAALVTC